VPDEEAAADGDAVPDADATSHTNADTVPDEDARARPDVAADELVEAQEPLAVAPVVRTGGTWVPRGVPRPAGRRRGVRIP
jgi:hypothetical protein